MKKQSLYKPVVLIILDGWGINPAWGRNIISSARPKHFDYYWRNYPHLVLQSFSKIASSTGIVSMPEYGHAIIGSGRLVYPPSKLISDQVQSGSFYQNHVLNDITNQAFNNKSSIHLIGLISNAGVVSELDHLYALISYFKTKALPNLYIHGILDGVDSGPTDGIGFIDHLEQKLKSLNYGNLVTLMGRKWIFEDEVNDVNIQASISTLVSTHKAYKAQTGVDLIKYSYNKNASDADVAPTIILSEDPERSRIKSNDIVIFFNFKDENVKKAIDDLSGKAKQIYSLVDYHNTKTTPIFTDTKIENHLTQVINENHLKQLKITDNNKEKHLCYYFNGMSEKRFFREKRIIIKSEYNLDPTKYPELNLYELMNKTKNEIHLKNYDFAAINIPNVDIVAHSGDILACQKSIIYTDEALSTIVEEVLQKQGCVLITSDHGNAEELGVVSSLKQQVKHFHTLNPVPLIMVNPDNKIQKPKIIQTVDSGSIIGQIVQSELSTADIAPTILELLGIDKPIEMHGKSLLSTLNSKNT